MTRYGTVFSGEPETGEREEGLGCVAYEVLAQCLSSPMLCLLGLRSLTLLPLGADPILSRSSFMFAVGERSAKITSRSAKDFADGGWHGVQACAVGCLLSVHS